MSTTAGASSQGETQQSLPKSLLVYSAAPTAASEGNQLAATLPPSSPSAVLDTNTVLDWLVFQEPTVAPLALALESGALRWMACPGMRDELARTLGYRLLAKWKPDSERVLSTFDRLVCLQSKPPVAPLHLRCSDPDDQVFLDLALAHGTRWLLTHDRALLRLARRARPIGLAILRPQDWVAPNLA